jgi:hypothetical protein
MGRPAFVFEAMQDGHGVGVELSFEMRGPFSGSTRLRTHDHDPAGQDVGQAERLPGMD